MQGNFHACGAYYIRKAAGHGWQYIFSQQGPQQQADRDSYCGQEQRLAAYQLFQLPAGCADGLYVTREYAVAEGALRILVFSADGSQVAAADGEKVSVMALPAGSYVARAIFADRAMSVKFVR